MIFLLDRFDVDFIDKDCIHHFAQMSLWETTESRVKGWIQNERCRSFFSRKEIINLFQTGKIQMVKVDKISVKPFDKIILWTKDKRFFVLEVHEPLDKIIPKE